MAFTIRGLAVEPFHLLRPQLSRRVGPSLLRSARAIRAAPQKIDVIFDRADEIRHHAA